jgi:hypothetical protein
LDVHLAVRSLAGLLDQRLANGEKILRWFRVDTQQVTRAEALFQKWDLGFVLFGLSSSCTGLG